MITKFEDSTQKAYFSVSFKTLRNMLNLPDSWEILGVLPPLADRFNPQGIDIVVTGPELPECTDGQPLEGVVLLFEEHELKAVSGNHYICEVKDD